MKITLDLNNKEMKALLQMIYAGYTVLSVNQDEEDETVHIAYDQFMEQYNKQDTQSPFHLDEEEGIFVPEDEWEHEIFHLMEAYEETAYWQLLTEELTERDLTEKHPDQEFGIEEYIEKSEPIREKYLDEFEENGIARLRIQS